ncbi:MAG: hypothetical protein AAFQ82_27310 [Myxococcota bacterium]
MSLSAALVVLLPLTAEARPFRVSQIPNAPASCNTCHTNGGGTPRNAFGLDVESRLVGGTLGDVDWDAVCDLDSDGDGFTNGEELGDPDCVWTESDGSLGTVASLPGSAESFPGEEGDVGEMLEAAEDGGCQAAGASLLPMALAAMTLLRRRRRVVLK